MVLQLIEKLRMHARQRPGDIVMRQIIPDNGRAVTWRELSDRVDLLSDALARMLPPKSVVMLCSSNRPELTASFLALLAAGMHVFPLATDIAAAELTSAAKRAGAAALIAIGQPALPVAGVFSHCRPLPECSDDALLHEVPTSPAQQRDGAGLLLLSSGTTGRPKIVRRDAKSLDAVSANMEEAIGFTPCDRVLAAVPLSHSYGMEHGLLCPIWGGSCTHLYDRFDLPAVLDELIRDAITVFPGVPFMFETMVGGAGVDVSKPGSLRRVYSAGGPLPMSLFDAFLGKFGVPIAQLYGATEIGSVTFNDPAIAPFSPASVGRPMRDVSIRILDPASARPESHELFAAEGHVAIKAASMLSEYIDDEPPPLHDGHFLTGDLGRVDSDGALFVTGRIKLLIDVAGRKVNPLEVEQVLCSHPDVGECVVVPLRVSPTLNRLRAVMTPGRAGQTPGAGELRRFARAHLSAYKIPRVFEFRDALPRSAAGKILRQVLESETTG